MKSRANSRHVKYLRQSVSLTGLGTSLFDTAIDGLADVYAAYSEFISLPKLAPCGIVDEYDRFTTIELSNRYLTSKRTTPTHEHIPFNPDVDPQGLLTSAAGNAYIHTEHNVVKYYESVREHQNKIRWVKTTTQRQKD